MEEIKQTDEISSPSGPLSSVGIDNSNDDLLSEPSSNMPIEGSHYKSPFDDCENDPIGVRDDGGFRIFDEARDKIEEQDFEKMYPVIHDEEIYIAIPRPSGEIIYVPGCAEWLLNKASGWEDAMIFSDSMLVPSITALVQTDENYPSFNPLVEEDLEDLIEILPSDLFKLNFAEAATLDELFNFAETINNDDIPLIFDTIGPSISTPMNDDCPEMPFDVVESSQKQKLECKTEIQLPENIEQGNSCVEIRIPTPMDVDCPEASDEVIQSSVIAPTQEEQQGSIRSEDTAESSGLRDTQVEEGSDSDAEPEIIILPPKIGMNEKRIDSMKELIKTIPEETLKNYYDYRVMYFNMLNARDDLSD